MQEQYTLTLNGLEKQPTDAPMDQTSEDLSLSSEEPMEQMAEITSNGTKKQAYNEADQDERIKKRQKRLLQNRQSAANSRAKKKEYVSRLETQIKALEDELRKAHHRIEELELFKKAVEMREQQHDVHVTHEAEVESADAKNEDTSQPVSASGDS
eukprot:TRINITY_DN2085_c0_g1_i4.p1 TRINITY_DN2085_c0_g1~~TRINITY_DN2085_c0_g1_i4.p1  ORF type:complete len:155 (-),score=40.80 TRINITY_DN2085_c0_g1_i4:125-589(-)